MSNVLDGTTKIKTTQWPSFLYPNGTVYNPECLDEGLFRGEVFLQVDFPLRFLLSADPDD